MHQAIQEDAGFLRPQLKAYQSGQNVEHLKCNEGPQRWRREGAPEALGNRDHHAGLLIVRRWTGAFQVVLGYRKLSASLLAEAQIPYAGLAHAELGHLTR